VELVRAAEQARCGRVAVLLVYVIFNLHTQGSCVRYLCLYVLYRKWGSYDALEIHQSIEGGKQQRNGQRNCVPSQTLILATT